MNRRQLLLWAAVAVPLIMAIGMIGYDWHMTERAAEQKVNTVADAIREHSETVLSSVGVLLDRIEQQVTLDGWNDLSIDPRMHQFLETLIANVPQAESAFLVSADGRIAKALIATCATSAAGVVAQLQGHLRWCNEEGDAEYDALCRIVNDLTRFMPVVEPRQPNHRADSIHDLRNGLEDQTAKLDSLERLLRYMADAADGEDGRPEVGAFWSLMNIVEFIKNDTQALVCRMMVLEREVRS